MADEQHLSIIRSGVTAWNRWRVKNPEIRPDLGGSDLMNMDLEGIDLSHANLARAVLTHSKASNATFASADLRGLTAVNVGLQNADFTYCSMGTQVGARTNLAGADLKNAVFRNADLQRVDLTTADLRGAQFQFTGPVGVGVGARLGRADLRDADLSHTSLRRALIDHSSLRDANLEGADLREAFLDHSDLTGANLRFARLISTKLNHADLSRCLVYGVSAWDVRMSGTAQEDLVITKPDSAALMVDSLEVAQFIYLLLHNEKLRTVIDTITSKVVLLLGRFSIERKLVLEALRKALRANGYLPVMCDFDKPASRGLTETISLLAHMSRFVVADLTDARSVPQELMKIVPDLPSVPIQPILSESAEEYGMFEHFKRFTSVLPVWRYVDTVHLTTSVTQEVIAPAERLHGRLKPTGMT